MMAMVLVMVLILKMISLGVLTFNYYGRNPQHTQEPTPQNIQMWTNHMLDFYMSSINTLNLSFRFHDILKRYLFYPNSAAKIILSEITELDILIKLFFEPCLFVYL